MNELFDKVCKVICEGEKVTFIDITDERRNGEFLYPRQLIMYFAKEFKLGSLAEIARPFGRDHATVINSCKSIKNYIDTDRYKRKQIDEYQVKITGIKKAMSMIEMFKIELEKLNKEISEIGTKFVNIQLSYNNIVKYIDTLKL